MINISNITIRQGDRLLLENASVQISDGWKVGLVGANGCGKTTLYRAIRGEIETQTGEICYSSHQQLVFVEQEFSPEDLSQKILDYVLSQDKERAELLLQLETASPDEMAQIHEQLKIIEADTAPARAAGILYGLGFSQSEMSQEIREFSGGWQRRIALAAALFRRSDILLLDEPTNHLDLEASIWLEKHLEHYKGTLLLISHDTSILNNICTHIIHFDHGKLVLYTGNYDNFSRTRALRQDILSKQAEKIAAQRKHLQSFVDRFRYKASKAKQAQSRMKMLEKLEDVTLLENDPTTIFSFPPVNVLPSPFLSIEDGVAGYGDKVVLKKLNFQLAENDKIALLGANGNGKSTLAKVISGRLPLLSGSRKVSSKLKIGYFAQHQNTELPLDLSAYEYMQTLMPDKTETQIRAHLAGFGLNKEKALTQIAKLSGGEKARLLFAAMTYDAPQLLILDEPTNHLDIDGREALIKALNDYSGAVILITHDMHFLELTADELWLVEKGQCKKYLGDLADYREHLLLKSQAVCKEEKNAKEKAPVAKGLSWQEKKQLQSTIRKLEKEMSQLSLEKVEIEKKFQALLPTDELIALQKRLTAVEQSLQEAENNWLSVSEKLESNY